MPTALESQPETEGGQNTSEGGAEDKGQEEKPSPEQLTPALDKIETAIRDLIAQERAAQGQGPKDEEIRDLKAQERMAFWAKLMFWATTAAVILTLAGIVLIRYTLKYTKIAAGHTEEMLTEARKTTEAGISTANEARRQADIAEESLRRLERPYLFPKVVGSDNLTNRSSTQPFAKMVLENYGKTPAILRQHSAQIVVSVELPPIFRSVSSVEFYEIIPPGGTSQGMIVRVINAAPGDFWREGDLGQLVLQGRFIYEDPAGSVFADGYCRRSDSRANFTIIQGERDYNYRRKVGPDGEENA